MPHHQNKDIINKPNFPNRSLWNYDNLDVLRGIDTGCVNLIYGDPPFNSDAVYQATPGSKAAGQKFNDRWTWGDAKDDWLFQLEDDWPQIYRAVLTARECHSNSMGGYIAHMAVRLVECHRVLRPDGSIYLHCDPGASPYLRTLMDAIFGEKQFRNEIVWRRTPRVHASFQHAPKQWGSQTDCILYYSKGQNAYLKPYRELTEAELKKLFPLMDNGRPYHNKKPLFNSPTMGARPNQCYEWHGVRNPHPSGWRLTKESLQAEYERGTVVINENGSIERRQYIDEYRGKPQGNLWDDISIAAGRERTGWSTQKPAALLERIIRASSSEDDLVFDPWCGCATTMAVAEKLNRRWAGCDYEPYAIGVVVERLSEIWMTPEERARLDAGQRRLFVEQKANLAPELPVRSTNDIDNLQLLAAPEYHRAALAPWQKLTRQQMFDHLAVIQDTELNGTVQCPCCGIILHRRYFHLDHRLPKADGGANDISNRMLLCGPCNNDKGADNTAVGQFGENTKKGLCQPGWDRRAYRSMTSRIANGVERLKRELK